MTSEATPSQSLASFFPLPVLLLLSLGAYTVLGYFTERENLAQLFPLFGILFLTYFLAWKVHRQQFTTLLWAGILFRVVMAFALPALSDDLYRFVWDGQLWVNGENPFLHLPKYYADAGYPINGLTPELYEGMNSKEYFTIYPPVLQFIFGLSALISPDNLYGSVLVMKMTILLAELGSIFLIIKLLKHFNLPKANALIYVLNPLIIFELCGSLHFEALMIFFLLLSLYWMVTKGWLWSSVAMTLAICCKLLPLMFFPFLIRRLGWVRSIQYFILSGALTLILFLPFINLELIQNFRSSLDLYFETFEFNASVHYLIRGIGYLFVDYNIIRTAGWLLSLTVLITILVMAWKEKGKDWISLPRFMLLAMTIYFAMATIVHPWYVTTLVALSVFTRFRYAIVWSATICLSYYAYKDTTYTESYWLIAIEYSAVLLWFIWEFRTQKNRLPEAG